MDLERALGPGPSSLSTFLQSDRATGSDFQQELGMGHFDFISAFEYIRGSDLDRDVECTKDIATVFQACAPGALSLEQVEQDIDLGQWKLRIGDMIVCLEVRMEAFGRND